MSRPIRLPGCDMSASQSDDLRDCILAAACLEEIQFSETSVSHQQLGGDVVKSGHSSADYRLSRQNAFDQNRLHRQSRSDPLPIPSYRVREIEAVEESSGRGFNESITMESQYSRKQDSYSRSTNESIEEEPLSSDYSDTSREPPHFHRSTSEGGCQVRRQNSILRNMHQNSATVKSDNESSSLFLGTIDSDICGRNSHNAISTKDSMDHSLEALQRSLFKNGIKDFIQRCESWKTVTPSSFQDLVARYIETSSSSSARRHGNSDQASSLDGISSSFIDSENDSEILKQLESSARCHDNRCQRCIEIRKALKIPSSGKIPQSNQSMPYDENLLMDMYNHSINCWRIRCPFHWCERISKPLSSQQEKLELMKQRIENFLSDAFLEGGDQQRFISLHQNFPIYPEEGEDWTVLVRLGHSRYTILALPTKQDCFDNLDYWLIKKAPLLEDDVCQELLYTRLREMQNPGIIQHLWAVVLKRHNLFAVCSVYQGVSLQEKVQARPVDSLEDAVGLMLQVTRILKCLHHKNILFLNWSASNFIVDSSLKSIKLADFTASALSDRIESVIGDVEAYLPVHLHPPELFILKPERKLDEQSDIWGLGCLLHEMVTGKPVWYQYQHDTLDVLMKKMECEKRPPIPTTLSELTVVFETCWMENRFKRKTLKELNRLLQGTLTLNH